MAEDDIYGNKRRYELKVENLKYLHLPPQDRPLKKSYKAKYYCKNKDNIKHFRSLIGHMEARDVSYIHRLRMLQDLLFITHYTAKPLETLTRDDINLIMISMHKAYKTPSSKTHFIKHVKNIWRHLFPEKDAQGRIDEAITPYAVRHLSPKVDKSKEKMRKDKLTFEEIEKIITYFSKDPRIQAYITLAYESLGRPQEILYLKIGNIELHDNYAKIWLTEHGKEGTGLLQCIDSYPYLLKWLEQHPLKNNPESYLFINTGTPNKLKQLKPLYINKLLRKAASDLGIEKPITCYSLKRNGITMRRQRGESDMEIQHAARWTSTSQLKIYDLSTQTDAFTQQLQKRGLTTTTQTHNPLKSNICAFCNTKTASTDITCPKCKRPINRLKIIEEQKKDDKIKELQGNINTMKEQYDRIKQEIMTDLMKEILEKKEHQNQEELNGNLSSNNSSKTEVNDLPLATSP